MPQDMEEWTIRALQRYEGLTADPKNLSRYIVALVDKHKSISSLKSTCRKQLQEFLGDSTEDFVYSLVKKLDHSSPSSHHSERRQRHRDDPISDDESPRAGRKRRSSDDRRYRRDYHERPSKRHRDSRGERERSRERTHDEHEYAADNPGLEVWSPDRTQDRPPSNFRGRSKRSGRQSRRYDKDNRRNKPRDSCILQVNNIPKENNSIASLNEHFQQFGTIVNIEVRQDRGSAYIKFADHASANAAHKSPQPIFGNRFIKVFFHNDKEIPREEMKETKAVQPTVPRNFSIRNSSAENRLTPFQILQNQKKELRKKQIEQQQEILKLLQAPNLDNATKVSLVKQLEELTESVEQSLKEDSTMLEAHQKAKYPPAPAKEILKQKLDEELEVITSEEPSIAPLEDKLASLRQQADEIMGAGPVSIPAPFYTRGRGRGRGRGFIPRGYRGGYRGRGRGAFPVARGPMSIDNRTCTIMLEDPPAALLDDGPLSELFQKFGTIEDISIGDNTATVRFSTRREAEKAMRGVSYEGQELTLSWKEKEQQQAEQETQEEEEEILDESKDPADISDEEEAYWNQ